eukprot:715793-Hanusia_phi.AAC.1
MLTREFNDLMLKRIGCGADGSFSSPSPLDWNRAHFTHSIAPRLGPPRIHVGQESELVRAEDVRSKL